MTSGSDKTKAAPAAAVAKSWPKVVAGGIAVLLVALAIASWWLLGRPRATPQPAGPRVQASFVGSAACESCHAAEYRAWKGSQHERAMQHASADTVLGDFNDAKFRYAGVESRFFKRDGKFFVRTDGPDGKLADFEIQYTYGVFPLQQYLIEFPDGRIQALSISWDARPKAEGGQRWFHQYPNERVDYRDELHWTRRAQNWNFMCADCHSTDVRKNYDATTNRFDTKWAEISVGCEACHGPGSNHLAWTRDKTADATKGLTVTFDERRGVSWRIDPVTGNAGRSAPKDSDVEIGVCAQCHARRAQIAEGYHAGEGFLDHYLPALLTPPLYYPDGQQRGEVYIWGSFLQSKMYAKGVTCSDCHDPHSQKTRLSGNGVCAQCHLPAKYDSPAHHFHVAGKPGSRCVDCHMPATTYMVIDPRRDHSMRVPRPDLSASLGTPNACNGCHKDKDARWAEAAMENWYGHQPRGFQQFAAAFDAAERGAAQAGPELVAMLNDPAQPAIVRATAAAALQRYPSPEMLAALRRGLQNFDPLLRHASLGALEALPPEQRAALAAPLLGDPVRTVRIEAARLLAPAAASLVGAQRDAFDAAAKEYVDTLRYTADRPESRTALGTFYGTLGRYNEAERALRSAIALAPRYVPAYANLADLRRAQGRNADAEALLREGLAAVPDDASLHHALGLALVRLRRMPEALRELSRAAALAPDDARFAYVYAVGLNSAGRRAEALKELERALKQHPDDRELRAARAEFAR
ncbi:MAG: tetratricopeptide repeat protein [Bacteroidota bacterium]